MGNRFFLEKSKEARESGWCLQGNLLPLQRVLIRFGERSYEGSNWWDPLLLVWLDNILK